MINGKTQLLGIFGDPVSHSLSPVMQNAALAAAGIDAVYLPFHVSPERLESAVEAIRTFNLVGVNVTVPHKEHVVPFLDTVDETAALIGAVNTIVNRNGQLVGFNTDATGFLTSMQSDLSFTPSEKHVVVLGAGGACRAALAALSEAGASRITVANRTKERALILAREMQPHFPATAFVAADLSEAELAGDITLADSLVNTTSLGLSGESFPDFIIDQLPESAVVYDMVYAIEATPLISSARHRGLCCADGRGMLIGQGEAAFSLWFGVEPEPGVMRSQVVEK